MYDVNIIKTHYTISKMPDTPNLSAIIQQAVGRQPLITEEELDFLLGLVRGGPAAEKSAQRGHDFVQRLGFDRVTLRTTLEQQVVGSDLAGRAIEARANPFGGPLLKLRSVVVGPSDVSAQLVSIWEVTDVHLRLVTAWTEIHQVQDRID